MTLRLRPERIPFCEALLPLVFFTDEKIFCVAALAPVTAGISMLMLQALPQRMNLNDKKTVLLFWLTGCGALGWLTLHIPVYWLLSLYLLLPAAVLNPPNKGKPRGFLFNIKKYTPRRLRELGRALVAALLFASASYFTRHYFRGAAVWFAAIFLLLGIEIVMCQTAEQMK